MEKHTNPEVVIVGAGIGGSALATVLARARIAVTLLEKSLVHVDHVRGEWLALVGRRGNPTPRLVRDLLAAGGHHLGRHIGYSDDIDPATAESQLLDFKAFESAGFKPPLCMRHPDMCDLLNREAIKVGRRTASRRDRFAGSRREPRPKCDSGTTASSASSIRASSSAPTAATRSCVRKWASISIAIRRIT